MNSSQISLNIYSQNLRGNWKQSYTEALRGAAHRVHDPESFEYPISPTREVLLRYLDKLIENKKDNGASRNTIEILCMQEMNSDDMKGLLVNPESRKRDFHGLMTYRFSKLVHNFKDKVKGLIRKGRIYPELPLRYLKGIKGESSSQEISSEPLIYEATVHDSEQKERPFNSREGITTITTLVSGDIVDSIEKEDIDPIPDEGLLRIPARVFLGWTSPESSGLLTKVNLKNDQGFFSVLNMHPAALGNPEKRVRILEAALEKIKSQKEKASHKFKGAVLVGDLNMFEPAERQEILKVLEKDGWQIPKAKSSSNQDIDVQGQMNSALVHTPFYTYDGSIKGKRLLDICATLGISDVQLNYRDKGRSDHTGMDIEAKLAA